MSERKRATTRPRFLSDIRHLFSVLCLLIPVLCLLSCGFRPIYGAHDDHTAVAEELNAVAIENISSLQGNVTSHEGQMLRNGLIDRMYGKGRPHNPKYHLEIKLNSTEEGIGLLPNATTSLTEVTVIANYSLEDETGKELWHATAHAVANFDQLQAQFGTLAARDNAYERSLNDLADQIVNRVSLYFSEGNVIAPPPSITPQPQTPGVPPTLTP